MPYIPPHSSPLADMSFSQIRLGIQGAPGTGKTYAAVSFPNPIVLDLDNKLGAHKTRKDILVLPFHDPDFIINKLKVHNEPYKEGEGRDIPNSPPFDQWPPLADR